MCRCRDEFVCVFLKYESQVLLVKYGDCKVRKLIFVDNMLYLELLIV